MWSKNTVPGFGCESLVANFEKKLSFQNIPPFVLSIMVMKGRTTFFISSGFKYIKITISINCRNFTIEFISLQ